MGEKAIKNIIRILFVIYCVILFYILFLYSARTGNQFNLATFSKEHIEMVNITPLKTLLDFKDRINNSTINIGIVVQNILANLLMFIPMGMALPVLFKDKFNKLWKIVVFIVCLVLGVEIIQFLTFCGSADIDDLVLNTIGCMIGYGIVQIKCVRKLFKLD